MGGDDHRCEWRERAERLEVELAAAHATIAELKGQLAQLQEVVQKLQRHVFGQRSEKMPPVAQELRRKGITSADREAALAKRRENAEKKKALPAREILHKIPEEKKVCPKCGLSVFKPLGPGKRTTIYEHVPATFERQVHVQEVARCQCGETILTAEGPPKAFEKAGYGPGFLAHLVVSKCCDSIPLTRLAKQYRRTGIPLNRSTLIDLFHRTAAETSPLWRRLVELVPALEIAQADETTMRVLAKHKTRTAYLWTFLGRDADDKEIIAYQFSPTRSGETPVRVLGDSKGKFVVDAFSGYNKVTTPAGRLRCGCIAHVRRKFFDALPKAEDAARTALDFILEIYKVEVEAKQRGIAGSDEHLALRRERSRPAMDAFHAWLEAEKPKHLPKGPMGEAIGYALNQWQTLIAFLDDPRLPVDNNASEGALRAAALGRKNFLFVGHDKAGENLAGLYSLVATCEANGVNPAAYLSDVLVRLDTHPAARIDELLPHRWKPTPANTS
jgi:transposase